MRHPIVAAAVRGAALVALGALVPGCGDADAQSMVTLAAESDELACGASVDPQTGTWESGPWHPDDTDECPWLEYRGGMMLKLEHGLDRRPRTVHVYISFRPGGQDSSLASGDTARVVRVSATHVTIQNATEQKFFVRVAVR